MTVEFPILRRNKTHGAALMTLGKVTLYLNRPAAELHKVTSPQFILLGFDKDRRCIVIKLLKENQVGATALHKAGAGFQIGATGFYRYFDIKPDGRHLPVKKTEDGFEIFLMEIRP